jgi:hypothetical protein
MVFVKMSTAMTIIIHGAVTAYSIQRNAFRSTGVIRDEVVVPDLLVAGVVGPVRELKISQRAQFWSSSLRALLLHFLVYGTTLFRSPTELLLLLLAFLRSRIRGRGLGRGERSLCDY